MTQEFHVLKCFSCETFQVHIVKKVRKWECKMCGAKQSLKRNYGRGTAKDCRNHVMKLNELRLTMVNSSGQNEDETCGDSTEILEKQEVKEVMKGKESTKSKWDEYLEDDTNDPKTDTDDEIFDFYLASAKNKKRNKKSTQEYYPKRKKICTESSLSEVFPEPNKETIPKFSSIEKKFMNKKSPVIDSKLQKSKYAKYMDEEEGEDKLAEENECLGIFESEPTDLDNLLKFE